MTDKSKMNIAAARSYLVSTVFLTFVKLFSLYMIVTVGFGIPVASWTAILAPAFLYYIASSMITTRTLAMKELIDKDKS